MKVLLPLIISTIAGLSTVIGALFIFLRFQKDNISKFISFCLAFSLSVMICISITDLIPSSSLNLLSTYKLSKGLIICLISFLIGVFSINFINKKLKNIKKGSSLYKVGVLSMLALALHNLPEGIATFMSSYQDLELGLKLSLAIICHNIPEGIAIAIPIYYATSSKTQALKKTLISGLTEPLGAILAYLFLAKYITNELISIILIFVAGIMITLSINDLFPEAIKYQKKKYIILGLVSGSIVMLINHFLL